MLLPDRPVVVFSLIASLIVIWTFAPPLHDYATGLLYPPPFPISSSSRAEREFLTLATAIEYPHPFNSSSIQSICSRTTFRPGLLFTCENQHGGVGMLRNQILKCVRYAIHAGAAIVVPKIQVRDPKVLWDIETKREVGLEYLFDREVFRRRLGEGCPGLVVYDEREEFPHWEHRIGEVDVVASQFDPLTPTGQLSSPRTWRDSFNHFLRTSNLSSSPSPLHPIHVKIQQSFLEYPILSDDQPPTHSFSQQFGQILSFLPSTLYLASKILWELKTRYNLPIDPSKAINENAYYGAHLRLEQDALWAWPESEGWVFGGRDAQFREQLEGVRGSGLGVVYVASGNLSVVEDFSQYLSTQLSLSSLASHEPPRSISVVTKEDLLSGPDLELMNSMSFDQRGLIDFIVMFKSSQFMGVAHSSFPWTVALRRHELSMYEGVQNEGSDLLRDEWSVIMGMRRDYVDVDPFVEAVWP